MTEKQGFHLSPLRILGWVEEALAYIGLALVFILMLVTSVNIILRYVFSSPLKGTVEVSGLIMVVIVFLPLAYVQSHGGQIRVDVLISHLPSRAQKIAEAIILIICLGICTILIWQTSRGALNSIKINDVTAGIVNITTIPSRVSIVVGLFVLSLTLLAQLIHNVRSQFQLVSEGKEGGKVEGIQDSYL